jgi:Mn2+/Fe2+ NRAMP family transporter
MGMNRIESAPKGLAIFALVGPSLIWCAEYIGSGEVILATRTGSILGTSVLWAVILGIFLKYWIGMSGARYTVSTGEGMVDMFARMPGPKNWAVWIVLIAQFFSGAIAIGSLAAAAGIFVNSLLPITSYWGGWLVTIVSLLTVWSGIYERLKIVMSFFIVVIVIGVLYVAFHVLPDLGELLRGMLPREPTVPQWAILSGTDENPWRELLPLIGWGAGGFASQVWYTYWVMGAGYGATKGRGYGKPADISSLKNYNISDAIKIKGWFKVVYTDATLAMVIGVLVTVSFLIAGAGVLGPMHLAPEGPEVALTLSNLFSASWGQLGGFLFLLGGAAALIATQIGQMAGWPRLLADTFRICIPGFQRRFKWKTQFRLFLVFFLITNMVIVFTLGVKPVSLVKLAALLDGLLLTPLQALWVGLGLYFVVPKLFKKEVAEIIKPHWIFALGLLVAFLVFGYFCVFQIPFIF